MLSPLVNRFAVAYSLQIDEQTSHLEFLVLLNVAPSGQVTDYDRQSLPVYAELLDADTAGMGWAESARSILGLDVVADRMTARRCWESHLARARWIVGEGLGSALETFGRNA